MPRRIPLRRSRCLAFPKRAKLTPSSLLHRKLFRAKVRRQDSREREHVEQARVAPERDLRDPGPFHACGVRDGLVGGESSGLHCLGERTRFARLRHEATCATSHSRSQAPAVRIAKLTFRTSRSYVREVATSLPDQFRAWLEAVRVELVPRHSKRGVALHVGLPVSSVNRLMRGERNAVNLENIGKMAAHLGVSVAYLFDCIERGELIRAIPGPPKQAKPREKARALG